jgi:uncharacterized membrane protein (UPF0127 family)
MRSTTLIAADGSAIACDVRRSLLGRGWGYLLRRRLRPDDALLLVLPQASIAGARIHTCGVFCPLAVVWLASDGAVVATALARPGRRGYRPPAPARYILEGPPALLQRVAVGQHLRGAPLPAPPRPSQGGEP